MNPTSRFTIALAGNPNVGKSTIFNALTGMHQHTGNWSGKTVACAEGLYRSVCGSCLVVDLPGTYSLRTHSREEEIAGDYIASGNAHLLLVVCDATCPERGLRLLKQIRELGSSCPKAVILCVNLCDEAAKKGISIDFPLLREKLGIPVIPCTARKKGGLRELREQIDGIWRAWEEASQKDPAPAEHLNGREPFCPCCPFQSLQTDEEPLSLPCCSCRGCCREEAEPILSLSLSLSPSLDRGAPSVPSGSRRSTEDGAEGEPVIRDFSPARLAARAVSFQNPGFLKRQLQIDRFVTGPVTGGLVMLLLLLAVFWLTITGANYPSAFLWDHLFALEDRLSLLLAGLGAPQWVISCSVYGIYRVVAWVVSVMLPPMAIFFPLFTLLEDLGYLPRAAFNMDCAFKRCRACGKQCLTMCLVIAPQNQ